MPNSSAQSFHAVLFPHRSLSRRGFWITMGIVTAALGFAGLRALAFGAWPVACFAVLDVALLYGAFRLSYRSGRAFEEVSVSPAEVLVRKVTPAGRVTEHRFQTMWARLSVTRVDDEGVTRLDLGSHGRSITIGAFLNPDDRASFADAFSAALSRARTG
ncbi:DUF2244 domain-containing protein [Acuticoccus mangrovi]|uniref:DUF2244 domain-containing protein n=1 Tax=Acuticoccus mangrovi TaxID=2796142 RepID=A0A934IER3_9HYPH|nr:DUF2244 domain-containing protein [Acuticoccus mangrovi]MBJ3775264.1 DUF2244 domain-containing protein [Acuticoccus mangrovi]